jgi:spectinomycin phosphotransferase
MLEKPNLPDEKIIACLRDEYGIHTVDLIFLPLGADMNTAVYRAAADKAYFVKLRRGNFDEGAVLIPKILHEQGVSDVIPPLPTVSNQLWAELDEYKLTVSPFVEGRNGWEQPLTDHQWMMFGRALKGLHTAIIPADVLKRVPQETFSSLWRQRVTMFQVMAEEDTFDDSVAAELADFLNRKRDVVSDLVHRADQLSAVVQSQTLENFLCHADIHLGNLLITQDGKLYIVDWDTLIRAPKERDLMFIGGGVGSYYSDEERLFYEGYGQTPINQTALAYYRFERIVQDIAAYCEQLLLTDEGGDDRAEGLRQLKSQFEPGAVIDQAYRTSQ